MSTAVDTTATAEKLDVLRLRADFPILSTTMRGKPLAFLDTAASAQKPQVVIDTIADIYRTSYANIHRGVYELSAEVTRRYEGVRETVRAFLGAADPREIVFVRNATEAINLVAYSYGGANIGAGDEILISAMEHHANIVPWQMLCQRSGAVLRVIPIDDRGDLELDRFHELLSERTKLVALAHVSNALGTVNPVREVIAAAHAKGAVVLLDGAQSVPHAKVDVAELDCDFFAFSGHKLYGPGVGVLHAKKALLEAMPPFLGGGDMIASVSFEETTYAEVPHKFEAGTPDIAGVIGMGAAIDYVSGVGIDRIAAYEHELLEYANARLTEVPGLRFVGTARDKAAVISFVLDGIHPHDIGTVLDSEGVAIRAGHHCAQPVMERYGIPATARASLSFYNTRDDVDALVRGLYRAREIFG